MSVKAVVNTTKENFISSVGGILARTTTYFGDQVAMIRLYKYEEKNVTNVRGFFMYLDGEISDHLDISLL
jgi:hypothetical protein